MINLSETERRVLNGLLVFCVALMVAFITAEILVFTGRI